MAYSRKGGNVTHYDAYIENQKYIDLPKIKSLKLSKIILLKNEALPSNASSIRSLGNLTNVIKGNIYINDEYRDVGVTEQHHRVLQFYNLNESYYRNNKKLKSRTFS